MPTEEEPRVGTWYETPEGRTFVVLAVDGTGDVIDIQYVQGAVEQIDKDVWSAMETAEVEPPENWHGSMDDFLSGRRRRWEYRSTGAWAVQARAASPCP